MRFVLPALLCLPGCIAETGTSDATMVGEDEPDAWGEPRRREDAGTSAPSSPWGDCGGSECATFELPLWWNDDGDGGPRIDVAVKRFRAREQPASGQLWLLQGGPGGSVTRLEAAVAAFREIAPDHDIYLPEHRGVGHSTRLGCGVFSEEAFGPRCGMALQQTWGARLDAFTTTAAAADLNRLVERMRVPGQPVTLYGVSYGTYWAHRALQLQRDVADAVVLDSMCPPQGCGYALYDERFDEVGREYLSFCATDDRCRARLTDDPAGWSQGLMRAVRGGHCEPIAERFPALQRLLAAFLAGWETRVMVPALIHRLDRCNLNDRLLLQALLDQVGDAVAADAGPDSVALQHHVLLSELWHRDLDAAHLEAVQGDLIFATGGPVAAAALRTTWPTYPHDEFVAEWAETDVPLLILSGSLDPQTPPGVANWAQGRYEGAGQHFVTVPWAAHGVVFQSPTVDGTQCGAELMSDFLRDPVDLDRSCLDRLRRPDFDGGRVARDYLGVDDLWDAELDDDAVELLQGDPETQARWDDIRRARTWF